MRTKRSLLFAAAIVPTILLSGCAYKYSYKTGLPASGEKIEKWQNIVGWGWGTPDPVYLDKMSPTGAVAEFGNYESFLNWLCTFFTLGFYSPQTIYVIPANPAPAEGDSKK